MVTASSPNKREPNNIHGSHNTTGEQHYMDSSAEAAGRHVHNSCGVLQAIEKLEEALLQELEAESETSQDEDCAHDEEQDRAVALRTNRPIVPEGEPFLSGHRDWEEWNWRFTMKARLADLSGHIESGGRVPLPQKPSIPRLDDYLPSSTQSAEDAMDRLRSDRDEFIRKMAIYEDRKLGLAQLRDWIEHTVAQPIYEACCDPEAEVWEWHANITTAIDEKKKEHEERTDRRKKCLAERLEQCYLILHDRLTQRQDGPLRLTNEPAPEGDTRTLPANEAYRKFLEHEYTLKQLQQPLLGLPALSQASAPKEEATVTAPEVVETAVSAMEVVPADATQPSQSPPATQNNTLKRKASAAGFSDVIREHSMEPRAKVRRYLEALEMHPTETAESAPLPSTAHTNTESVASRSESSESGESCYDTAGTSGTGSLANEVGIEQPVPLVEVNESVPVSPAAETNIEWTTSGTESFEMESSEAEEYSESTYSSVTATPPRRGGVSKPMPPVVRTVTDRRLFVAQESSEVPLAEAKQSVPMSPIACNHHKKTPSVAETAENGESSSASFASYTPSPPCRGNIQQPVAPTVHPVLQRKPSVIVKSEMTEGTNTSLSSDVAETAVGGGIQQPSPHLLATARHVHNLKSRRFRLWSRHSFNGFKDATTGAACWHDHNKDFVLTVPTPYPFQFLKQTRLIQGGKILSDEPKDSIKDLEGKISLHVGGLKQLLQDSKDGFGVLPGCKRRENCLGHEIWRLTKYMKELNHEVRTHAEKLSAADDAA